MTRLKTALTVTALLVLSACGSAGANNVSSCKAFYSTLKCGSTDLTGQTSSCAAYGNTNCDISAYFDCWSTHYVCSNGSYDMAALQTAGQCSTKATCG